ESAFDGFSRLSLKGLDCRGGVGWGWWGLPFANGGAGQALRFARPPTLHRAFCKMEAGPGFSSGNLASAHFPPHLQSVPIAGKGVTTFGDTHLNLDFQP